MVQQFLHKRLLRGYDYVKPYLGIAAVELQYSLFKQRTECIRRTYA